MRALLLAVWCLLLTGCVAVDRRTVVLAIDAARDEVRVLTVFEGIHPGSDFDIAKRELKKFVESRQEFCLAGCDWLFGHVDISESSYKSSSESTAAAALTRGHFTIRNQAFFLNPEGRLCGWQEITVRNPRRYFQNLNRLISAYVSAALLRESPEGVPWDDATVRLLTAAASGPYPWVGVESGRVSVTIPGSPAFFQHYKAELVEKAFKTDERTSSVHYNPDGAREVSGSVTRASSLEEVKAIFKDWSEKPISLDQRHDRMVISYGYGGDMPLHIGTLKAEKEKGEDDLRDFAAGLGLPLLPSASTEAIVAEFLKAGTADPQRIGAR